MSYHLRNYRHRNPKGGDEKKTSSPFFEGSQKGSVQKKKKGGFFQTKLAVGEKGDSHEKEADAAAARVTKPAGEAAGVKKKELAGVQRLATSKEDEKLATNDARMEKDKEEPMKPVQKKDAPEKKKEEKPVQKADDPKKEKKEKPVQKSDEKKKKKGAQKSGDKKKEKSAGPAKEEKKEKPVQKKEAPEKKKEEKPVQKKAESTTTDAVAEEIQKQSGKGSPLPPKVLAEMNKSFGVDFSNVRIHSDAAAAKLCQELHAQAFTHGQDVFFNEGKYNPESAEGKMLLAHELTHVVQQANSIDV